MTADREQVLLLLASTTTLKKMLTIACWRPDAKCSHSALLQLLCWVCSTAAVCRGSRGANVQGCKFFCDIFLYEIVSFVALANQMPAVAESTGYPSVIWLEDVTMSLQWLRLQMFSLIPHRLVRKWLWFFFFVVVFLSCACSRITILADGAAGHWSHWHFANVPLDLSPAASMTPSWQVLKGSSFLREMLMCF